MKKGEILRNPLVALPTATLVAMGYLSVTGCSSANESSKSGEITSEVVQGHVDELLADAHAVEKSRKNQAPEPYESIAEYYSQKPTFNTEDSGDVDPIPRWKAETSPVSIRVEDYGEESDYIFTRWDSEGNRIEEQIIATRTRTLNGVRHKTDDIIKFTYPSSIGKDGMKTWTPDGTLKGHKLTDLKSGLNDAGNILEKFGAEAPDAIQ